MKSGGSPPPVHVHVPETTPVHVHMRRSPSKQLQNQAKDEVKDGGKSRVPWVPPGRSCRRDVGPGTPQRASERSNKPDAEQQDGVRQNLQILLREHQSILSEARGPHRDTDVLLRALVEAEIDGAAVSNQMTALMETVHSMSKDKRTSHAAALGRQRGLLLEKVQMFISSNHSLRGLLREWSEFQRESHAWSQQEDALKKRLAEREAENMTLQAKLSNKDKEASELAAHLDFEKDSVKTAEELSNILESTCSRLKTQLSHAEVDKVQLAAQVQKLQQSHKQKQEELQVQQEELQVLQEELQVQQEELQVQQEELQVQQEELQTLRQIKEDEEARKDQEVLLMERAERAEASTRQLSEELQEKETRLSQALSTSRDWCLRHSQEAAAKGLLGEEISVLRLRVTELNSQLHTMKERNREEEEELRNQLHHLSAENTSTKLDKQRLQTELTSCEEKLRGVHVEARRLKSLIRKYENLVEKNKKKVHQARLEAEENLLKMEVCQKEAQKVKLSLEREKEQVRQELLDRLRELEMLPDRLRRTEQQLRDVQQEADVHQRRNMENNTTLSRVRHQVEQQGVQLEMLQQTNVLLQEENDVLKEKILTLERKLEDTNTENKDMSHDLSLKDGSVRSLQQQLEDKSRECSVLSRQLQQTVHDAQRQVDDGMQRVLAKERVSQSKALDLQSQLSQARTELSQLQRSKDQMQQCFQNQLQNLKERLEQSDSTNRSLHSYVHFLKTSYGNVFADSLLAR